MTIRAVMGEDGGGVREQPTDVRIFDSAKADSWIRSSPYAFTLVESKEGRMGGKYYRCFCRGGDEVSAITGKPSVP